MRIMSYIAKEMKEAYESAKLLLNPESSVRKLASLKVDEGVFIVGSLFDEKYDYYKDTTKTIQIELYKLERSNTLNDYESHLKGLYESFLEATRALKEAQASTSTERDENVSERFKELQGILLVIRQYTNVV